MNDHHCRHLEVCIVGSRTIVTFTQSQLDDAAVRALNDDLDHLAEELGTGELHLDFGRVEYLSSAGLGKAVALHQRLSAAGGRLALVNLGPLLYELFEVTHLNKVLDVRRAPTDSASVESGPLHGSDRS